MQLKVTGWDLDRSDNSGIKKIKMGRRDTFLSTSSMIEDKIRYKIGDHISIVGINGNISSFEIQGFTVFGDESSPHIVEQLQFGQYNNDFRVRVIGKLTHRNGITTDEGEYFDLGHIREFGKSGVGINKPFADIQRGVKGSTERILVAAE